MNRRDFFKMAGIGIAGLLFPAQTERQTMSTIGSVLEKLANQEPLTGDERQRLVLWGNQTETVSSFVSGLQNGGSDVFAKSLNSLDFPINVIFSKNLEANTTTLDVKIPSNYKHLLILSSGRCTKAGVAADSLMAQINSDTSSNYETQVLYGVNSTAGTTQSLRTDGAIVGGLIDDNVAAGKCGSGFVFLPNYNANLYKTFLSIVNPGAGSDIYIISGMWKSTEAVRNISFFSSADDIKQGAAISVYGLK